jgi:hypothetical protein
MGKTPQRRSIKKMATKKRKRHKREFRFPSLFPCVFCVLCVSSWLNFFWLLPSLSASAYLGALCGELSALVVGRAKRGSAGGLCIARSSHLVFLTNNFLPLFRALGCGRSPHGIYPRFNPLPLTLHSGRAPSLIHRAGGVAAAGVTALPNRRKGTADERR